MRGGYHIIDFQDVNIHTDDGATVIGLYESLEQNHRKTVLLSGVTIDGVEKPNCFIECEVSGSDFTFSAYGKTFTVTNEDKVTIA